MKKIYYRNTKPKKKVKLANFNGVSEDWYSKNAPVDFAVKQENLMTQNGSLVESLSPKSTGVQFESKILKVIPYYEDSTKLLVICEDKSYILYSENNQVETIEVEHNFEIIDTASYKYGEENYLVVATDKGLKKFQNGNFEDSEIDTNFDKICNHYYRIFGAQANSTKLIFSDDFAPFNWNESYDEGGYINLPQEKGNITDLISFNQSLVVCQEDGFCKITAFSEQDEFTMKTISSPCNVKSGSVADCGDYIMFATTKGLGILDGYTTKTICEELAGYLKKCEVRGVAVDDYCYFLCKNKENSIADAFIIAYSLTHRNYHFINCHNANTIEACKFNSKDYLLIIEDKEIKFLSSNSNSDNKIWLSGSLDFGSPSEEKLLRKIEFGGKTIIDLRIAADGKNYFFNISHQRSQLLNLKGRNFEIEIIPKGKNISVPSPILEYQLLEVE